MPTIQYRTPDGQVQTTDLQDAPPQIQALYNTNYAQVQSQTQSAGQTAEQSSLNTAYLQAPQNLKADLQGGMTLDDAMSKYKSLKMNPDDIFSQYVSSNTFGPNKTPKYPVENYPQLKAMGVSDKILGNVGDFGSPADKWNTKNALDELRLAKQYFQQTKAADIAGNIADINKYSAAYENARLIAGEHLSSLVPGASGAQATGQTFLNTLPSSKDIRSYTPGMIDSKFDSDEKMLLAQKGYDYKTLGLTNPMESKDNQGEQPSSGGDLLDTLLKGATSDVRGLKATSDVASIQGLLTNPDARSLVSNAILHPVNTGENMLSGLLNTVGVKSNVDSSGMKVNIPKSGDELLSNILDNAKQHPVNTAMTLTGLLNGAGATGDSGVADTVAAGATKTGESAVADATGSIKVPGNLKTSLLPNSSSDAGFALKANAIQTLKAAGKTIPGDDVSAYVDSQVASLKRSFPNVDPAEIDTWAKNIGKNWKGQQFDPQQAVDDYNMTPTDKTISGLQKERLADHQNGILRDAISKTIESQAPGAGWKDGVAAQARAFAAKKSPLSKIIPNLPANALRGILMGTPLAIVAKALNL